MCDEKSNVCPNYIISTVMNIDRMQKEAVVSENQCVTCNNSLLQAAFNTLPVSFVLDGGQYLTAYTSLVTPDCYDENSTIYFKIEAVRCNQFATLRLLEVTKVDDEKTLVETNETITLDLESVVAIKCHTPISTSSCSLT